MQIRVLIAGRKQVQLTNRAANIVAPPTVDEKAKVEGIIARGIARAQNTPVRSCDEIWAEFDAAWAEIAAEAEQIETKRKKRSKRCLKLS